jgi:hypothetical protein
MIPKVGDKYLVTTDRWFLAPDGESYLAVHGTVNAIHTDQDTLGVKTNAKSTNWYLSIGDMMVAGCQIHYAIKSDSVSFRAPNREIEHEGGLKVCRNDRTRIYDADASGEHLE